MTMTKIEMMKQQINWKIEFPTREMKENKERLADCVKCSDYEIANWAAHYAERFQKAFEEIKRLNEEYEMLLLLEKGEE